MNEVAIPGNFGQVSTRFQGESVENDLGAGVQQSYGVIGYRGKVWSIRHRGEKRDLMREDGDGPRNSIEVVIIKAAGNLSKVFYPTWKEDSSDPPACFSTNGVTPDPSVTNKVCATCAACPNNVWGSRITDAGKKGKACSDSKRMAIVPLVDLKNEPFGGPMLLRVPAGSLNDLAAYGDGMKRLGFPYYAVGTRISFDPAQAYPKFVFKGIRPLTDEEADVILELRGGDRVSRILAEGSEHVVAGPANQQAQLAAAFEQPPVTQQAKVDTWSQPQSQPQSHTTGATSSQFAPPAASTGSARPQQGQSAPPLAHATPSTQAAPPEQNHNGGAVSAQTHSITSDFEAELDAKLAELMPA